MPAACTRAARDAQRQCFSPSPSPVSAIEPNPTTSAKRRTIRDSSRPPVSRNGHISREEWSELNIEIDAANALYAARKTKTIDLCLFLSRLRKRLKPRHGWWIALIRSGKLHLKKTAVDDYARAGEALEGLNDHFRGRLPYKTKALLEVCCLSPEAIKRLIIQRKIHRSLTHAKARELVEHELGLPSPEPLMPNLARRRERLTECLDWIDNWPEKEFESFEQELTDFLATMRTHQSLKGKERTQKFSTAIL